MVERKPVRDAAAFLLRHGISGAPVLDEHGRWAGVFTQNDLARYLQNRIAPAALDRTLESRELIANLFALPADEFGNTPVKEFMTAGMFTIFTINGAGATPAASTAVSPQALALDRGWRPLGEHRGH